MIMKRAAIIDIVRTPWGIPGGAMAKLKSHDLAATVLSALSARNGTIPDGLITGFAALFHVSVKYARYALFTALAGEHTCIYGVTAHPACRLYVVHTT